MARASTRRSSAAEPGLQGPLARGLAVAHVNEPLVTRGVVDRAMALVATGGASALAAANLLATVRLTDGEVAALARAFADAEPSVWRRCAVRFAARRRVGAGLRRSSPPPPSPSRFGPPPPGALGGFPTHVRRWRSRRAAPKDRSRPTRAPRWPAAPEEAPEEGSVAGRSGCARPTARRSPDAGSRSRAAASRSPR